MNEYSWNACFAPTWWWEGRPKTEARDLASSSKSLERSGLLSCLSLVFISQLNSAHVCLKS